jgi:hypothetical protein
MPIELLGLAIHLGWMGNVAKSCQEILMAGVSVIESIADPQADTIGKST